MALLPAYDGDHLLQVGFGKKPGAEVKPGVPENLGGPEVAENTFIVLHPPPPADREV